MTDIDDIDAGLSHLRSYIDNLIRDRDGLLEEVEGLRAVRPDLPDVGPVTRDDRGQLVCGSSLASVGTTADDLHGYIRQALLSAAELSAIADRLDAEVDPVYEAVAEVLAEHGCDETKVHGTALEVARRHRARQAGDAR